MEAQHRTTAPDLVETISPEAQGYSFFSLTELMLKYLEHEVEEAALHKQGPEGLMFLVDPSLGFPTSDVAGVRRMGDDDHSPVAMTVNFMGLHGASSPLPDYLLEPIAQSRNEGPESTQQGLTNFFSNRMVWFLYLIWRKYRYDLRYKPNAQDQFSNWIFSLIGLEGTDVREGSSIDFAKLLAFVGLAAGRTRSPEQMGQIIAYMFDLPAAEIEEFTERVVPIDPAQQLSIGQANASLGHDTVVGTSQKDIAGRFTIHLKGLSFKRFGDFLPRGKDFPKIKELVEYLLKDQLAYDLKLTLEQGETPRLQLGSQENGYLGWTSFIGNVEPEGTVRSISVLARA